MTWFVYMVRCVDNSLYTGVTTDLTRRVNEHNGVDKIKVGRGAKYTKARRPVELVYQEVVSGRGEAQRREASLRRLSKADKQALLDANKSLPRTIL